MKIQCDVCEKAPASVICGADEAALCASCDVQIHAANKLASKHQRILLNSFSNNKLPRCDICQEKAAFIFCVEDRALFCPECDRPIHVTGTPSGNHQRFLATDIHVGGFTHASSPCNNKNNPTKVFPDPPNNFSTTISSNVPASAATLEAASSAFAPSAWAVEEFLQLSDNESGYKKGSPIGFGDLDWYADIGLFNEQVPNPKEAMITAVAEVPELPKNGGNHSVAYKMNKSGMLTKKRRIEASCDDDDDDDDDEFFTVPDLG